MPADTGRWSLWAGWTLKSTDGRTTPAGGRRQRSRKLQRRCTPTAPARWRASPLPSHPIACHCAIACGSTAQARRVARPRRCRPLNLPAPLAAFLRWPLALPLEAADSRYAAIVHGCQVDPLRGDVKPYGAAFTPLQRVANGSIRAGLVHKQHLRSHGINRWEALQALQRACRASETQAAPGG